MQETVDVLICGAGPVGLTLASQLESMGVSWRLIDKAVCPSGKSKALVLWGRSLELLNTSLDAGVFLAAGRPVRNANFYWKGDAFAQLDFSEGEDKFGTGILIPQNSTEQILVDDLVQAGGEIERGTELLSFEQIHGKVRCMVSDQSGKHETIMARFMVGCDGAHSAVRHGLGLSFEGVKDGLRWVLADVELTGDVPDADVLSMWSPLGILLLFHFEKDTWRVVAEEPLASENAPRRDPTLQEIQQHLDRRGARKLRVSNPKWLAEFRVSERIVKDYQMGSVFLAGDAAHVHSPAGGQGMNTGIQDACNLAWKLAWNLRGVGTPLLLESYAAERHRIGQHVVRTTSRITRLATTDSRLLQGIRNIVAGIALRFEWIRRKVKANLGEYAVNYRQSDINGRDSRRHRNAFRCGDRVPDFSWFDGDGHKQSLYQRLSGGRAVLIILNEGAHHTPEVWKELTDRHEGSFNVVKLFLSGDFSDESTRLKSDSEMVACGVVPAEEASKLPFGNGGWGVIRPDGYLAALGDCDDMSAATQWLLRVTSL